MNVIVKVIGRGQVVIPKNVRDALKIQEGDLLNLKIEKVKERKEKPPLEMMIYKDE